MADMAVTRMGISVPQTMHNQVARAAGAFGSSALCLQRSVSDAEVVGELLFDGSQDCSDLGQGGVCEFDMSRHGVLGG
jgi:hypothetical protein